MNVLSCTGVAVEILDVQKALRSGIYLLMRATILAEVKELFKL